LTNVKDLKLYFLYN